MRYHAIVRAAAVVLSAAALSAVAQTEQPVQPEPATMIDTAPPPAHDRSSVGAVILMDEPVLAQRETMQQALARSEPDTRAMGAGNRLLQQLHQEFLRSPQRPRVPAMMEEQRAQ